MNKIPTIFDRDWQGDRSRVINQVVPGCEWVMDGEGVATRKYDGTCVMFDSEEWWARREVKDGKPMPPGFVSSGHDHTTLKNVGWEPIVQSPFLKFHREALAYPNPVTGTFVVGTYELCGPKVQGNPEGFLTHVLIQHAEAERQEPEARTFAEIRDSLDFLGWEGYVFHHEDGRMAKIKARDFGIRRAA